MAPARSFRDFDAWNVAMQLAVACYALAKRLPPTERFELGSQIRRAVTSIPANIAEGQATGKPGRFLYHTRVALGSLGELETQLELANRIGMLADHDLAEALPLLARTGQLLNGLARTLRRRVLTQTAAGSALLAIAALGLHLFAISGKVSLRVAMNDVFTLALTTLNLVLARIDVDVLAHLTLLVPL
jgi:four helix bundle protein